MATQYTDLAYKTIEGQTEKEVYNPTTGKVYGKPESLAADLGIAPTAIDWNKIGTGMNAGDLGTGSLAVPTAPKYSPDNAVNYWQSTAAGLQPQMEQYQKALEAQLSNQPQMNMTDVLSTQYEKWGVSGMFDQLKTWTEEANAVRTNIATLQDQENQALLSTEGQAVSLATIKGRQSIIARQYDSKIAAEGARLAGYGAMIESVRGNLSMAQSFANEYVQAATYDYQVKRDTWTAFYNYNKDMFNYLGGEYQNAVKNMMSEANKEYEAQKAERQAIADLALQFPTAAKEILAAKNYDEAVAIAQGPAAQLWNARLADLTDKNGNIDTGNTMFLSTMQAEIDAGSTPEEAALVAAATAEQLGIQLSAKDRAELVKIAKTLTKTTTPTEPEKKPGIKIGIPKTPVDLSGIESKIQLSPTGTASMPGAKATEGGFFQSLFGG